ncbi:peptidoglycan D,D-transpeptidase FtsI family protein [Longirhabdus pacifica]|uniref:peptidoglycan D,D-transpeptidase FtsI family protein n=1 Tax=Longirhabdus pacifica TaxID=2305227 RepID=UPI001008BBAA|nr:penicillin-binding transpeptidase domain-containing protein [Longirhabdus pacifica]
MKHRIFIVLISITFLISILITRLFWLQVMPMFSGDSLTKQAVAQRKQSVQIMSGRGHIVDPNGVPFTGETIQSLAVFPAHMAHINTQSTTEEVLQWDTLASILQSSTQSLKEEWSGEVYPFLWSDEHGDPVSLSSEQVQQLEGIYFPGLLVVPYEKRYRPPYIASHLVGFVSEHPEAVLDTYAHGQQHHHIDVYSEIGASGLEKSMNTYLKSVGATEISTFVDGRGNPMEEIGMTLSMPNHKYYPVELTMSVQYDVQAEVEAVIDLYLQHRPFITKTAAVVMDVEEQEIVAMVSRPSFNPEHITGDTWSNHAVKAEIPGSIFKLIVAAAALENGVVNEEDTFQCDGAYGKYGFVCWKRDGHGVIDVEQAIAQSCNIAFAEMANRLTATEIEGFAQKLGVLSKVGNDVDEEENGQVFAAGTNGDDEGVKIQTAIGQRDVLMTPLQAANLMVTFLHEGNVKQPQIIKKITFKNGSTVQEEDEMLYDSTLSPKTVQFMQQAMQAVVTNGTGSALQYLNWDVAGKSGTAQVAETNEVNEWFIGYGPVNNPKYAIAVMVRDTVQTSTHEATVLFGELMELWSEQKNSDIP